MNDGSKKVERTSGKGTRGGKRLAKGPREPEAQRRRSAEQTAEAAQTMPRGRTSRREERSPLAATSHAVELSQKAASAVSTQERPASGHHGARAAIPAWDRERSADPAETPAVDLIERLKRSAQHWQETEGTDSPFLRLYRRAQSETKRARRRWRHIAREKRAKRFPESERRLIQLLLFGWSMLPALNSHLREILQGSRKRSDQRSARLRSWIDRWRLHPVAFLATACGLAAVVLLCSTYTFGTTVLYDGEVVATVSSRSAAEQARTDLEEVTARTLGESYTIDDTQIQYDSGLLLRQDVVDGETFEEQLSEEIGLVTAAYCLYVDGELIGATPYEGALDELLEQMKASATNADTISISFAEDVEIEYGYVPTEKIMNLGYLAETLYSTKTAEVTYEVKQGDTWSEIAEDHGLTSKEMLALNPGYDIDKLQIGEVLTLSEAVPYLTMTVVQRERYIDDVPFEIEYTDSADLYKGDYKVISAGEYGAADVVANVTYVNGTETERTILSSVTLKEPVTEQRLQGTKERPTWLPTGTFRWPITGRITSRFGGRSSPGGIGSTNHKGIDIAGRYGTPVYAADGGTVTYAGWMGGYGYLVRIDHGNGYETYYGHNSSLTVSVGEHVYKGQQIARVGSTGNSTGNHCHFEVRYNGVARNPLNYLP